MLTKLSSKKQDDWDDYIDVACFQLLMRHLAHGGESERLTYNQNVLRKHLYHSFINGKLTPFPSKLITKISASAIFKIEIHCHCRMPELKTTPMIECTNCCKWYHTFYAPRAFRRNV